MVRRTGSSEKKETWYGEKYTQHYDPDGNKSGTSKVEKNWLGEERMQHYDSDGNKSGISREEKNWLGEKRIRHYGSENERPSDHTGGGDRYESSSSVDTDSPVTFLSILASIGVTTYYSGIIGMTGLPTISNLREALNYADTEFWFSFLISIFLWMAPMLVVYRMILLRSFVGVLLISLSIWGLFAGFVPIPNDQASSLVVSGLGIFLSTLFTAGMGEP